MFLDVMSLCRMNSDKCNVPEKKSGDYSTGDFCGQAAKSLHALFFFGPLVAQAYQLIISTFKAA